MNNKPANTFTVYDVPAKALILDALQNALYKFKK